MYLEHDAVKYLRNEFLRIMILRYFFFFIEYVFYNMTWWAW